MNFIQYNCIEVAELKRIHGKPTTRVHGFSHTTRSSIHNTEPYMIRQAWWSNRDCALIRGAYRMSYRSLKSKALNKARLRSFEVDGISQARGGNNLFYMDDQ